MKRPSKFIRVLRTYAEQKVIVEFDRSPLSNYNLRGLILWATESLVALRLVDDYYTFDSFTFLSIADIDRVRVSPNNEMITYILCQRDPDGFQQQLPEELSDKTDWSFLNHSSSLFPLITIHEEIKKNRVLSIGAFESMGKKSIRLRKVTYRGTWSEIAKSRFKDITRVDLGGRYEEGLWIYLNREGANEGEPYGR